MGMRQTDERISQKADRLHLTFLRDHLPEVLESIMAANMTPREAFDSAFGKEIEQRKINRFKQALQTAHFPCIRRLEEFDFSAQPSINPGTIQELAKLEWIATGENVAFFGAPGVGKTHLALALGYKALEHNYSVRFYSAAALLSMLEKAAREDALEARLKEINKYQLLIIDEIGYLPFSPAAAHLLFQVVARRYAKKSVMITSNRPPSEWHLIFADQAASTSLLDRILHHSTSLSILGSSYRVREHQRVAATKGLFCPRLTGASDRAVTIKLERNQGGWDRIACGRKRPIRSRPVPAANNRLLQEGHFYLDWSIRLSLDKYA